MISATGAVSLFPCEYLPEVPAEAGAVPVEMLGYSEFPAIDSSPYRLTLGPYGFYWFELQHADR